MKYAAYSKYKASNIGWIHAFPAHWELKRLKYIANRSEVKIEAGEDNPLPYIGLEQVEPWTGRLINLDDDLIPTGVSNYFAAGDTLFGKLRPYLAKACNVDFDGLCSSELLVLRGKTYDRKFLLYQLLSHGFINLVDSSTFGSKMPRASWDFIGICELPLPPVDEQQTIVRFLDAKTAQIDELIAKKRQLINKLKEKRQALIARTATRGLPPEAAKAAGLDPNPKMKESGVDWLGAVPARWKIKAIKWATPVQRGASPRPIDDPSYFDDDGEYAWVRISDVTAAGMYLDATEQRLSDLGSSLSVKMQPGSLFLSIAGTVGKPCIANIKCCIHDGFVYFPHWKGDSRFLFYVFASGEPYKGLGKMGTQLNLNTDTVGSIVIGIPDAAEQRLIADYLDRTTAELDSMTTAVEAAIDRLTEYRQALIISAVTGKIDVRDYAENHKEAA